MTEKQWYAVHTYSGHENKVKHNLEHRVETMGQGHRVRSVIVPTEQVSEIKDGQKIQVEKRTMPGYVLVQMDMTDNAWMLVKNRCARFRVSSVRRIARSKG